MPTDICKQNSKQVGVVSYLERVISRGIFGRNIKKSGQLDDCPPLLGLLALFYYQADLLISPQTTTLIPWLWHSPVSGSAPPVCHRYYEHGP